MPELDEARRIEKLRAIEALYVRPGTDGERTAAHDARERILARLRESVFAGGSLLIRAHRSLPRGVARSMRTA